LIGKENLISCKGSGVFLWDLKVKTYMCHLIRHEYFAVKYGGYSCRAFDFRDETAERKHSAIKKPTMIQLT
jgi:hypothetical protein